MGNLSDALLTETDIRNIIACSIPGISAFDIWDVRCDFIYNTYDLDKSIDDYKAKHGMS